MKVTPRTDKEIAEMNLWPEASYGFEVIEGLDKVSKSGNEMIELKLKVYNDDGGFIFVKDYLLDSLAYKIKHAAEACELVDQYNAKSLIGMDFVGKCGTLKLKIQKSKDSAYADKNVVGDYIVKKDGETAIMNGSASKPVEQVIQDECPF